MKLKGILLGAALASASAASAATIVQTSEFSFVPNDSTIETFAQFDTQGGTRVLTSVFIEIEYTKTGGSYEVDNESASTATVTLNHRINAQLSSALDLTRSGNSENLEDFPTSLRATSTLSGVSLGADDGDSPSNMDPSGADYFRYEPADLTKSTSGFLANTAQFEGAGSYDIAFDAEQTVGMTGVSGASQAFSPSTVNGFIRVTYTYTETTPVPEPSAALLGGLGTLVLLRRRRSA
jgi:MYXO-CTERM domain-containing protein